MDTEPFEYMGKRDLGENAGKFAFMDNTPENLQSVLFTLDQLIRHRNALTDIINKEQQPIYDKLHDVNPGNAGQIK